MGLRIITCIAAFFSYSQAVSATSLVLEGQQLYLEFCAKCHGQDAKGGAGTGAILPPDLTAIAERRDLIWPMLEVMSIIDGYTKTTVPREGMPVVSELTEGKQVDFDTGNGTVVPVPQNLLALVAYLESIQMPRPESYVP